MEDETQGWQSINAYSKDDLNSFLDDGHPLLVHVANKDEKPILMAKYWHKDGFEVMSEYGGRLENPAITHWMYEPELPY